MALKVIRKHRLWEVFLVEKLGFGWDEVHDIAEELEHIPSERLVERLDAYLGFPQFDPHGDPIPDSGGNMPANDYHTLSEVEAGQFVSVMGVLEHSPAFLQHLDRIGLALGHEIGVREVNTYDRSVLIALMPSGGTVFISQEVARNILVQKNDLSS